MMPGVAPDMTLDAVAIEPGLDRVPCLAIDDGGVLAPKPLAMVTDLADVERVAQQVDQPTATDISLSLK